MDNHKRISVDHLKPGMIINQDVINSNGLILIPHNTVITDKHIFRLKLYQVSEVTINTDNTNIKSTRVNSNSVDYIETLNKQTFNMFKDNYSTQEQILVDRLSNISNGKNIGIDDLLLINEPLLTSMKTKSDLFNYLYKLHTVDDYTYSHCLNVSILCNIFANWLNMSKKEIEEVTIAGLLHDIGKIKLDKNILHKPGKLSKKEFDHIKKHSQFGYDIIKSQNISTDIKMGVLLHHEKIDGSGYPLGLKGADIHKYAKIIAIADIYDAMTSDRPHRKKFSPFTAIQMFEQKSYGLLDTKFLFVFLENIAHNYLGTDVLLSTGKEAKIVFIHNTSPSRPIVQVDNSMIDLMVEPNIMINEII